MDNYSTAAIGAIFGAVATFIASRVTGKRSRFRCSRFDEQFSKNDNPAVGYSLTLKWQDHDIDNFTITRFHILNDSPRDFTDVPIRLWTGKDTMVLQDSVHHAKSLDVIEYAPHFLAQLHPDPQTGHSTSQVNLFNHQREYSVRVWNRFDAIEVTCLSSCPIGGNKGGVWIEINQPGVRLEERIEGQRQQKVLNVELSHIWGYCLFVLLLAIALPIYLLENKIAVGIVVGIGSSFGAYLAALLYHAKVRFKRLLSD